MPSILACAFSQKLAGVVVCDLYSAKDDHGDLTP